MKAIRIHERGGLKQLIYEDAPKPVPRRGDALVEVLAAGITPTELSWLSAYTTRDGCDRLPAIPGHEFSGIVAVSDGASKDVEHGEAVYAFSDFGVMDPMLSSLPWRPLISRRSPKPSILLKPRPCRFPR